MSKDPYSDLMLQLKVVKDRVRGVVSRTSNGFYLHGGPGTSKTYTVCKTLETLAVNYSYSSGHLTAMGLFSLLEQHSHSIIVLDDVSSIFREPKALQILLAALGNRHDETGARPVRYTTANKDLTIQFSGAIICISNLPLDGHHNEVMKALIDRVNVINYEPTEEQVISLIEHLAAKGL